MAIRKFHVAATMRQLRVIAKAGLIADDVAAEVLRDPLRKKK